MAKSTNSPGLINVFKELEKEEFSVNQLNSELSNLGISPTKLVAALREKLESIQAKRGISSTKVEFDPFLLAAGKKSSKKEKMVKKLGKKR